MDIFSLAVATFPSGATLPGTEYVVKGLGMRRHENAIIYYVPNSKQPAKPDEKGFTLSELHHAYQQLLSANEFARAWFDSEVARGNFGRGAPCNFLAIGAVFVGLDLATKKRGSFGLSASM